MQLPNKTGRATATMDATARQPPDMRSDMYTESEIDVKQIELEICSAAKTGAFALVVGPLLFVTQTQTEHTERHIEAYIVHDEHTHARTEIERSRGDSCAGVAQLVVIITFETRRSTAEAEVYLIEHRKTLFSG